MSSTEPALGSRENFWDHDSDAYASNQTEQTTGHTECSGVSREAYVAGNILREAGDPTLLCPRCHHELDEQGELSEPDDYVPRAEVLLVRDDETWVPADDYLTRDDVAVDGDLETHDRDTLLADLDVAYRDAEWYADHRRHRHCQNCGTISWGGILQDRPLADFLDIVADVLDYVDLPDRQAEQIRRRAQSRKQRNVSDEANMERIVSEIEHPQTLSSE